MLVRVLLATDGLLAAVYLLEAALGHPFSEVTRLVNLDGEGNVPTWYSSAQLLLLGLLLGAFALTQAEQPGKFRWALFMLPALCIAMSMDEVAQIHEWIGKRSDVLFPSGTRKGSFVPVTGVWMFLLGPPFLLLVVRLWRTLVPFLRRSRARVMRLYVLGFVVYAVSALGIEWLSNYVPSKGPASVIQIVCEELGEMLGVTVMIWATLELLSSYGIGLRVGDRPVR